MDVNATAFVSWDDEDYIPDYATLCKSTDPVEFTICRAAVLDIERYARLTWALPLYGYVIPLVIVVTCFTNSFVIAVLRQASMRSPTNYVLMVMSITELATGLSTLPWLLYYYTFAGYEFHKLYGMGRTWCLMSTYFSYSLPSYFHSASCWLTVYLAVQRYIYICQPRCVHRYCTIPAARRAVIAICLGVLLYQDPPTMPTYTWFTTAHPDNPLYLNITLPYEGPRRLCLSVLNELVARVGSNVYFNVTIWYKNIFAHILPSALLIFFTHGLLREMKRAERRRWALFDDSSLYAGGGGPRGGSHAETAPPAAPTACQPLLNEETNNNTTGGDQATSIDVHFRRCSQAPAAVANNSSGGGGRSSIGAVLLRNLDHAPSSERRRQTTIAEHGAHKTRGHKQDDTTSPNTSRRRPQHRRVEDHRVATMRQNTRMLVVIIVMFMVMELPAAVIQILYAFIVTLKLLWFYQYLSTFNAVFMFRNFFLVLLYPVRLIIYCSMSDQFRCTVHQMLLGGRDGGKRRRQHATTEVGHATTNNNNGRTRLASTNL